MAIITDPKHILFFTGFTPYNQRLLSLLFVKSRGEAILLAGSTELKRAEIAFRDTILSYEDYDVRKRMIVYPKIVG